MLSDRVDEWLMSHLMEHEGKSLKDVTPGVTWISMRIMKRKKRRWRKRRKTSESLSRAHERGPGRASGRCTTDGETDRVSRLPCGGRARDGCANAAYLGGGRPTGTGHAADIGNEPSHPLIERLDAESDEDRFNDLAHILMDQATLAEGSTLEDPAAYVSRLNKLLLDMSHT